MSMTSNKAVVLGAGGFIGINLVNELVSQGFEVLCFDQAVSRNWPKEARVVLGDFASVPPDLVCELDNAIVFHLVSSCRPSLETTSAADEIQRDFVSTVRYLEATKARELRWIFVSSGGTVYGESDDREIRESRPADPLCSYGALKFAIESYFSLYGKLYGLDYIVVRPANPYGPWQHPLRGQGLVTALVYKALIRDPIEIWGDGSNVRDYIYIEDVVSGILSAAMNGSMGEIYNIGTGQGLSINQLIEAIGATLNVPPKVSYGAARFIDVKRNVLSISKLSSHTGWTPKTPIHLGISLTAAWLKKSGLV